MGKLSLFSGKLNACWERDILYSDCTHVYMTLDPNRRNSIF